MDARITHMYGNWEHYTVGSVFQCHDETDKIAYETLWDIVCNKDPNEKALIMGKVLVERI